jgi:hypothetical protein
MQGYGKEKYIQKKTFYAEKPISLKSYKFDEAVSDLLKVKPEPKEEHKEEKQD